MKDITGRFNNGLHLETVTVSPLIIKVLSLLHAKALAENEKQQNVESSKQALCNMWWQLCVTDAIDITTVVNCI